ncbi:MsnO8 family LLM class oxidoreductase [Streptomyces sp. 3MP-14]|uniref:MsnO8 family LLM class oxidoreductase n=1 Tax=Streptomyces mimosae TaxID=2586635 RepID=A0A5N6A252_9ACTN|nr:MsnO8 family LLM class oxidoreductase [Streptomyces mimosae]KAB8179060.1 MsnO8 family LLM class oxidoreductase [Streptomyces sp. 3MP-14]
MSVRLADSRSTARFRRPLEASVIPLSVLDVAVIPPGGTARETLLDVVEVARAADQAGYRRFWVAEHHTSPRCAGSSPAVLMAHLAAVTRRVRVGSGGVMLPNHAPLAVAEQFAVLQALHDGRVDLGVGRATGGNEHAALLDRALRTSPAARDAFPELIDELLGFLHDDWPEGHPLAALRMSPLPAEPPEVFVLGSTENGGRVAASRGLPFVFGGHLGPRSRPTALARYRAEFRPGRHGPAGPRVIASVNVLCAESDEEAARLAWETSEAQVVEAHATRSPGQPLSPARQRHLTQQNLAEVQLVQGEPASVAAGLADVAATWGADELMVVPYGLTGKDRARVLHLLAPETSATPETDAVPGHG